MTISTERNSLQTLNQSLFKVDTPAANSRGVSRISPTESTILFDKYVFRKDQLIPDYIDLRGAICIERDSKHNSLLHKLMFLVQKIHEFLSKIFGWAPKQIDPNLCHGSIVVDRVRNEKGEVTGNDFVLNHSLLTGGVKTTTCKFQNESDVEEMIFYVPKDEKFKQELLNHTSQTCFDNRGTHGHKESERVNQFATLDLIRCSFHAPKKADKTIMKRTAKAVADLLRGDQFLDDKGDKLRSFFCIPYVTTVLSGTHLLRSLTNEQKDALRYSTAKTGQLRSRNEVARDIYRMMKDKNSVLGRTFRENPLNQVDTRFLGTAYVAELLDRYVQTTVDGRSATDLPILEPTRNAT